jgi:hypothetical protein
MNALTDTELKIQGMEALLASLGEVMTEKFIVLIRREPFDYTEWQRNLWPNMSVRELSTAAMDWRARSKSGD